MVTVMEYCSEGDLNDVIGNPRYDFMDLLTFMLEISKGVLYLHSSKVVHRDIKAENVLLMRNKIKITDFGLSKVMISNKSNRSNNMTKGIGTYSYMSPEMLDKQDYSYEVDIWAMGILFIEMVVGERISAIEQDQFPQKKPDFPN
jgi:serine/threonine protein kinase